MPKILRGDFSPKWDHLCPRYSGMILSPEWDHLCPRYLGVIFHPSGTISDQNVRFYLEAFIQLVLFCLLGGSFSFLFRCVQSGMRYEFFAAFPNHLQPWVSRVQETVLASKAEGTIRSHLADFKRWNLWALSNVFCHMPANTFHVAAYLKFLILKQILLLLHLMLFTVSTGINAWPVCRGFLILSFLP